MNFKYGSLYIQKMVDSIKWYSKQCYHRAITVNTLNCFRMWSRFLWTRMYESMWKLFRPNGLQSLQWNLFKGMSSRISWRHVQRSWDCCFVDFIYTTAFYNFVFYLFKNRLNFLAFLLKENFNFLIFKPLFGF